jgi:hypothetical protein
MDLLGSIGKALTDPGAIAQEALGNVLPKDISGVLGNVVAGAVDLSTGNEHQALQHTLLGLADLPQLGRSGASALSNLSSGGSANFEPGHPPGAAGNMVANGSWRQHPSLQSLLHHRLKHHRKEQQPINITININGAPEGAKSSGSSSGAKAGGSTDTAKTGGSTDTAKTGGSTDTAKTGGSTDAAKTGGSTDAAKTGGSTDAAKTGGSTDAAKTGGSTPATQTSSADLQKLLGMNNTDFMNAVRNGQIPDSVMNDPKAMMMIQDRMNQITQMNQLMTSMMQAMHQMEMSIIQNIRV